MASGTLVLAVLLGCARVGWGERNHFQGFRRHAHVTRLHRYAHTGLAAMVEAEARWDAGAGAELVKDPFLQLSKPQLEWLQGHHRRSALVQLGSTAQSRPSLRSVQNHHMAARHADQANTAVELPTTMLSSLDSQYVGPVGIGTVNRPAGCQAEKLTYIPHARAGPERKECHAEEESEVWVVFDTGSTNLWVASDLCMGSCNRGTRVRYNHALSQTFSQPQASADLHVQFGTGSLDGPLGSDDLHVGPFTIYNQSFAMIKDAKGSVFDNLPLEGILGLAFPAMAADGAPPFFDTIIHQKALPSNKFAFYFSLSNPAANAIFWGHVDNKFHDGPIEYFKVTDPYYWSVDLLSFHVGGDTVLDDQIPLGRGSLFIEQSATAVTPKAIVDTGTTFFTAGTGLYDRIRAKLPEAPCDSLTDESHPPIVFRLRNIDNEPVDFTLTNEQYMASNDGFCSPAFMQIDVPAEHGPGMILGEVFLRHYLAVFDRGDGRPENARVGFARSVHGEDVDRRLKDLTHNQATFTQARSDIM